ncbi:MAG: hypothetical protein WC662_02565 [Candidatus Paceibacterota bacterium]|jgi:hypothetical protein
MSKNLLQDMVSKKPVRKELLSNSNISKKIWESNSEIKVNSSNKKIDHGFIEQEQSEGGSKYGLWFVAIISIGFLLFALSYLFAGAKITLIPKTQDLTLNEIFSAEKESNTNVLAFDLVAITGEESKTVQGSEQKDFSEKAKGRVIIYNNFNSSSQNLSVDTRLEGSNGKIYKTDIKITVPGMNKDGTPGSAEVGIYASEAGEEYNSGPLDFKILGFKGTSKYEKFYGRSKGEISGGLKGKFSQISETDKVATTEELKNSLQEKLFQKVNDQIPDGFVLFKDAIFLKIDESGISSVSKDSSVPIIVKGTLYGFLFKEKDLADKIAKIAIKDYDGSEVYIPKIKDLVFALNNKENISFNDVKTINFNLSGSTKVVWKIDSDKLISELLGKRKKDFDQTLSQYKNIDSADLVIKPAWKMSFPEKIKDIKVIINYPNE